MLHTTRYMIALVITLGLSAGPLTDALASSTGRCGGTGGKHSKTLTCPSGQYVVGLRARGGAFVDQIGIRCAGFDAQGRRGALGAWLTTGPGGGTTSRDDVCEGNTAIAGIATKSGTYLDYVYEGRCKPRQKAGGFENRVPKSAEVNIGGPGGIYCECACPTGEALYSVTIKFGDWIDSIRGECRP